MGWDARGRGWRAHYFRISIHPSRVGWDFDTMMWLFVLHISIHPSRVGWDAKYIDTLDITLDFNPPIPCGMGQRRFDAAPEFLCISIHPSRVGWDAARFLRRPFL